MYLFYHPGINEADTITLSPEESKHCAKVLRQKVGDTLYITNGMGELFSGNLTEVHPAACVVQITGKRPGVDSHYKRLHLAVSPLRNPARFDWLLEKATEAGAGEITPVICHRTERHQVKTARWHKIVVAAMKQSLRTRFPVLNNPVSLSQFHETLTTRQRFIAYCGEDHATAPLHHALQPDLDAIVLIGPEGDFTAEEVERAIQHGFTPVTLGRTRLRSETAALSACFIFKQLNSY